MIVTFLEGDPDRPLVTGAVYNGLHTPPYPLPENKTRTVFRTQSHKADGYNEMYFEDKNDQEEVRFRAQKDMKTKVLNNRYRDIGNDEELKVGRNQENNILGDRKEDIDGHKTSLTKQTFMERVEEDVHVTYNSNESKKIVNNQDLSIDENRRTMIGKNDSMHIEANQETTILTSRSIKIGTDENLNINNHFNVEVNGNTSIHSSGGTTYISGKTIKVQVGYAGLILESSGKIHLYGSSITVDGGTESILKGGKVSINPGKSKSHFIEVPPYESFMRYNQSIILKDQSTGVVHANKQYKIVLENGKEIVGKTDAKGQTSLINTKDLESSFDIYWREI